MREHARARPRGEALEASSASPCLVATESGIILAAGGRACARIMQVASPALSRRPQHLGASWAGDVEHANEMAALSARRAMGWWRSTQPRPPLFLASAAVSETHAAAPPTPATTEVSPLAHAAAFSLACAVSSLGSSIASACAAWP